MSNRRKPHVDDPPDPSGDQIAAASADAKRRVRKALSGLPGAADMPTQQGDASGWWPELFARAFTPETGRCRHVAARPVQVMYLTAGEYVWRCQRCLEANVREQHARGCPPLFDAVEEHTCDRCRRYAPGDLDLLVYRQDLWVIAAGLCPECMTSAEQQAGGRILGPA